MTVRTPSNAVLLKPESPPRYDRGGGARPVLGPQIITKYQVH
jgi:hypothetical protein